MSDSLGDRMKGYEMAARTTMPRRVPVIMRLDGKAFHTWTRGMKRPFDDSFIASMNIVARRLCEEIQGAQLAYVQSDEISVLVHNYKRLASAAWFDNEIQKTVSVAASIAGAVMTLTAGRLAFFDARVFVLSEAEVCNYFVWRQQDATRNSIQSVAQSLYSPKELHQKNCAQLQDMIHEKGQNWNDLPTHLKRGRCVLRQVDEERPAWVVDPGTPIFTEDRAYIERHLDVEPEELAPVPRFV